MLIEGKFLQYRGGTVMYALAIHSIILFVILVVLLLPATTYLQMAGAAVAGWVWLALVEVVQAL